MQFTPYADGMRIDADALGAILDQAYADARVTPDDIDTGVVILTGEALRRRNAEAIAAVVSERAGDLVCASAGHHMEAMLAAYGSGAVRASHRDHGLGCSTSTSAAVPPSSRSWTTAGSPRPRRSTSAGAS